MPRVLLELPVPNADQLARYYDRVMIFRAVAGKVEAGWVEITSPSSRPALHAGQVVYRYTDEDGGPDDLYAAGFINTRTMAVSPVGEPVQGAGDPTESVLSVADFKARYLFGVPLKDARGNPMPDSLFRFWRQQAVQMVQERVGVQLTPKVVEDEAHDFVPSNISPAKMWLDTSLVPLRSLQSLRLDLPYQRLRRDVPSEWTRVKGHRGRIYVFPSGTWLLGEQMAGGWGLYGPSMLNDLVPGAWKVSYVAGFAPGEVPADLTDAVGKAAAIAPLNIAGDLLGKAGVVSRSLGIDGLSQSSALNRNAQGGVFGARVQGYQAELDRVLPQLRTRYRGIQILGM